MIPIRDNLNPTKIPIVTIFLISINIFVFLIQISLSERALLAVYNIFGIIPARFNNPYFENFYNFPIDAWLTIFTSMFLHGGLMHILMNMWVLYLFGNDVEDRLGHLKFLILYFASGIIAALTHIYIYPNSSIPTIGASGAVAGVMGAYYLLFPFAKLDILIPIFFYIELVSVPAFMFLPVWFIEQLFAGTLALASINFSNVAFWAHIGGFIGGLWLTFILVAIKNLTTNEVAYKSNIDKHSIIMYPRHYYLFNSARPLNPDNRNKIVIRPIKRKLFI